MHKGLFTYFIFSLDDWEILNISMEICKTLIEISIFVIEISIFGHFLLFQFFAQSVAKLNCPRALLQKFF